jgi:hypothetical protein
MKLLKHLFISVVLLLTACAPPPTNRTAPSSCTVTNEVIAIPLTEEKHSQVLEHANQAVNEGYPQILVLNRQGADSRRRALLKGIPTKPKMDRDEYPPAVGRTEIKASVKHIDSSQNRSAGSIMGNTLRNYCDGTKFTYPLKD